MQKWTMVNIFRQFVNLILFSDSLIKKSPKQTLLSLFNGRCHSC